MNKINYIKLIAPAILTLLPEGSSASSFKEDFYNTYDYDDADRQEIINTMAINDAYECFKLGELKQAKSNFDSIYNFIENTDDPSLNEKYGILKIFFQKKNKDESNISNNSVDNCNGINLIESDDVEIVNSDNARSRYLIEGVGIPCTQEYIGNSMDTSEERLNIAVVGGSTYSGIGIANTTSLEDNLKPLFLINKKSEIYNRRDGVRQDDLQLRMDWTSDDLPEELSNRFDCVILEQIEYPNLLITKTYENAFKALKPGGTLLFHGYTAGDYYIHCLNEKDKSLMAQLFTGNNLNVITYFIDGKLKNVGFDALNSSYNKTNITRESFYNLPILKQLTNNFTYDNRQLYYTPASHQFYIKGIKPQ